MGRKRTTLDAILPTKKATYGPAAETNPSSQKNDLGQSAQPLGRRPNVKQQALYLKHPIHRQLRTLAFEEEKKMHDLFLEAIDLLFADRGLPSCSELESE